MVPQTFIDIYLAILKKGNKIRVDKNKSKLYEYDKNISNWKIFFKSYANTIHILIPTNEIIYGIKPDVDWYVIERFGIIPKCKYLDCGRNTEYGYRSCPKHLSVCTVCGKKEAFANIDGFSKCRECLIK